MHVSMGIGSPNDTATLLKPHFQASEEIYIELHPDFFILLLEVIKRNVRERSKQCFRGRSLLGSMATQPTQPRARL